MELINTGSELLLGRVFNTHQQWLCRRLSDLGYEVTRQTCVADEGWAIEGAVRESLGRSDVVFVTGGLGPTSDDITRDLIAQLLGRRLIENAEVLGRIKAYFESIKRPLPPKVEVQALVPEGARVLTNYHGTAPGLAIPLVPNPFSKTGSNGWLILLPGPPRELYPMFLDSVAPLLKSELPVKAHFVCRTLRTAGIGESLLEHRVAPILEPLVHSGLILGYCARPGEVDVRLSGWGNKAEETVAKAEAMVRRELGSFVFGLDDESMEGVVVRLLTERKKTLVLAESCTGGFISNRITNISGASSVFLGGLVTYSNEAKKNLLKVSEESLEQFGAVSEQVAREMAEGARQRLRADFAISVTGIAGPTGTTEGKPLGTVFMALASEAGTTVLHQKNAFDRETFKFVTSQQALNLLRLALV